MAIADQDMPREKWGDKLEKIIDPLGSFLAFLTIALIAMLYINGQWDFLGEHAVMLWQIREYAIIATVGIKGLEFALKRNSLLVLIIYGALVAVVVIFSFLPDTGIALFHQLTSGSAVIF